MQRRISLSGSDWHFKEYYGEDWLWRDAHKPVSRDKLHWRTGSVPGSVHHDLWTLGEIPNPYFERNSLLIEWVPDRTWLYRKTFTVDDELRGSRVQLRFEGVDYEAQFFLNGERLGEHRGMFTPALFEVAHLLHYGAENTLAVVIKPAPHEQPQVSRTSKVRTHKSRMTYWWDFCPRMIHIGIWDDVVLEVTGAVRIDDVFVRPILADNFLRADIAVSADLNTAEPQPIEVETIIRFAGSVAATQRHSLQAGETSFELHLDLGQPNLWWPNGYGEQPLYDAEISIYDADRQLHDRRMVRFGIRRVELVPNETDDSTARPYTFVVNGRKLYATGWNWVPIDVMYGVPRPERVTHLLRLAKDAHVNLLRIWGGGLIETEAFYNRCDELGIMVWQEFIQSSSGIENTPSDSPEFIEMMLREAGEFIPRKRNHPSLVLWCGGNELQTLDGKPLDDSHPLLAGLKSTVARLDPDRHWLPSSPSGRSFLNTLDNTDIDPSSLHDVHGPWEYQGVEKQYELANRSTSLLHSEFGVEGITNWKSLTRTISEENRWPATRENPVWFHLGAWWNQSPMWQAVFGQISDIRTLQRATQMMQAEGLRYMLEADRRRKYRNSGTLPWQFNEPYPMATCTSAVDYFGQAKPSYYAVAHAYEPVHVSGKFPTIAWAGRDTFESEIWVNNSHECAFLDAVLHTRLAGVSGRIYADQSQPVSFGANTAASLSTVQWPLDQLAEDVFFLDLTLTHGAGHTLSQNRYPFTRATNLAPLLDVPRTELIWRTEHHADEWIVEIGNTGSIAALFVWLEDSREVGAPGWAYFSTNHFCLLPQETKIIRVSWCDVPASQRQLTGGGWNTEWGI